MRLVQNLGQVTVMSRNRYKAEQIVTVLRQIEVEIANGKTIPQACRVSSKRLGIGLPFSSLHNDAMILHRAVVLIQQ